jgi:hypothetical protein
VVNGTTIPYFSGLANHDAHAVIEENPFTQLRAWVNFNARDPTRKIGNKSPQPFEASTPACTGPTVKHHGMQAGVAGEDLPSRARSRIAIEDALDVGM